MAPSRLSGGTGEGGVLYHSVVDQMNLRAIAGAHENKDGAMNSLGDGDVISPNLRRNGDRFRPRLSNIITDYICTARNSAVQMHLVSPFSDCFFT